MIKNIANIKIGANQISKIMLGLNTIWENWKEITGEILNASYSQSSVSVGDKYATSSELSNGIKLREVSCTFYSKNNDSYNQGYAWTIEGYTGGAWKTLKSGTQYVNATSSSTWTETYTDTSDTLYTKMRYMLHTKANASINGKVTKWVQKGS